MRLRYLQVLKLRLTCEWVVSCVTNDNMIYFGVSILFEYLYFRYPSYTRQSRGSCSKYCHLLQSPYPYLRKSLFGWESLNSLFLVTCHKMLNGTISWHCLLAISTKTGHIHLNVRLKCTYVTTVAVENR